MVDDTNEAGRQAVERAAKAAEAVDTLGPGTAGQTTSGAAYRGREVAANTGAPHPADPGLPNRSGGGKLDNAGPA